MPLDTRFIKLSSSAGVPQLANLRRAKAGGKSAVCELTMRESVHGGWVGRLDGWINGAKVGSV